MFVRGLNALIASRHPDRGAVVAADRLRGGSANSTRGAAHLLAEAINTARATGVTAMIMVRADSAYYSRKFIAAARRAGAYFSVTSPMDAATRRAITSIPDHAWIGINYPNTIYDDTGEWISDAEIGDPQWGSPAIPVGQFFMIVRGVVGRVRRG